MVDQIAVGAEILLRALLDLCALVVDQAGRDNSHLVVAGVEENTAVVHTVVHTAVVVVAGSTAAAVAAAVAVAPVKAFAVMLFEP